MSRIKHPEYAEPPATVHPTDIVQGFVDPDEAARRWNLHPEMVSMLRKALEWVQHVEGEAWDYIPESMRGDESVAWALLSILDKIHKGA